MELSRSKRSVGHVDYTEMTQLHVYSIQKHQQGNILHICTDDAELKNVVKLHFGDAEVF